VRIETEEKISISRISFLALSTIQE